MNNLGRLFYGVDNKEVFLQTLGIVMFNNYNPTGRRSGKTVTSYYDIIWEFLKSPEITCRVHPTGDPDLDGSFRRNNQWMRGFYKYVSEYFKDYLSISVISHRSAILTKRTDNGLYV